MSASKLDALRVTCADPFVSTIPLRLLGIAAAVSIAVAFGGLVAGAGSQPTEAATGSEPVPVIPPFGA